MRCRNPERLLVELDWSILAMAVAELFALEARVAKKSKAREYDPKKRSLAKTMHALRYCLKHLDEVPASGKDLASNLAAARTDDYIRKSSKRSRYRPKNPDKKPLGDPKIRAIDAEEKAKLRKLKRDAKIRA